MKKKLIIGTLSASLLFGGFGAGAYASANGWLTFTGDEAIEQSQADVDRIMEILRQVNSDKMTAEQALAELQSLDPKGLAKQNKEFREQIAHLEAELARANKKAAEVKSKTGAALTEAEAMVND